MVQQHDKTSFSKTQKDAWQHFFFTMEWCLHGLLNLLLARFFCFLLVKSIFNSNNFILFTANNEKKKIVHVTWFWSLPSIKQCIWFFTLLEKIISKNVQYDTFKEFACNLKIRNFKVVFLKNSNKQKTCISHPKENKVKGP